jgi:endonuclease/exonuclease/phosphatase family metal-dependent hydrolase
MTQLHIATYNIHKGFSLLNRRVVLPALREQLRGLNADVIFLQEVQGAHDTHGLRHSNYPDAAQHEFLAEQVWAHHAYGMNAVYQAGHHGNAILSRYPIVKIHNENISAHRFESRGLLHCELEIGTTRVHSVCAHFGLFARGRSLQTRALIDYVQREIPAAAPLLIAGDFNDWRNQMSAALAHELGVQDVFHAQHGKPAKSFPARMPLFRLDRIYTRGFTVQKSRVHDDWQKLSDHAALSAHLSLLG